MAFSTNERALVVS